MPKRVRARKVDNRIIRTNLPHKFRIGTRKSGTSAVTMSTEDLKTVLETAGKGRWHQNARTVLATRGVTV